MLYAELAMALQDGMNADAEQCVGREIDIEWLPNNKGRPYWKSYVR